MVKTVKRNKKTRRIVSHAQVHINASFNNTIVSVTDEEGKVLTWSSGWAVWFKGAREATPYAAQVAAEDAVEKAVTLHSVETVDVYIKGIGIGREQAIRWVIAKGVDLRNIFDVTPVPHNGCRKKKVRKL